jgi:DNA invertase Pin-like site-specific DNA recombinase
MNQSAHNKCISLQAQEHECFKFASENKLNVKTVNKEVHTAYNRISKLLANVIANNTSTSIIFASSDRFSRNVKLGLKLASIAISNKNKLVFIQENFICSKKSDLEYLKKLLYISENESKMISIRAKRTRNYLISIGSFPGGAVPYGYNLVDKKLYINDTENNIIDFIKYCLSDNIIYNTLLSKLNKINSELSVGVKKNKIIANNIANIKDHLNNNKIPRFSFKEISVLLNNCNILKKLAMWSVPNIKTAIKGYDPKCDLDDFKVGNFDELFNAIDSISNYEEKINSLSITSNNVITTDLADDEFINTSSNIKEKTRKRKFSDDLSFDEISSSSKDNSLSNTSKKYIKRQKINCKLASDKLASDKRKSDKLASDKCKSDKLASDKLASYKLASYKPNMLKSLFAKYNIFNNSSSI